MMWTVFRSTSVLLVALAVCGASPWKSPSSGAHDQAPSTHALLSALGMRQLRVPAAHHRKRLAEQGRRHATGDSRMFVIKLPPNVNYYAHAQPAPEAARTLPLQLTGNGKPARVYHWNIPTLIKMAHNRPQARLDDTIVNVENKPTWLKGSQPHANSLNSLSYYIPSNKSSFRKYFSGNGKPKSFYVIDKSKKEEFHRLLP